MTFTESDLVKEIAEAVLDRMPQLAYIRDSGVRIAYMESDQKKRKNGGPVYADCEKVKPKFRAQMPYDFIITVYSKNCTAMTGDTLRLLLFHELMHVGAQRDEEGDLRTWIRPHDVEDFHEITDRVGTYWAEEGVGLSALTGEEEEG